MIKKLVAVTILTVFLVSTVLAIDFVSANGIFTNETDIISGEVPQKSTHTWTYEGPISGKVVLSGTLKDNLSTSVINSEGTYTDWDNVEGFELTEDFSIEIKNSHWMASLPYDITLTFTDDSTLPVELSAFDAVLLNTNNVQLNWTTQTEANMIGYNIYRANDENQANSIRVNNETIVATNTSSEHNYSFTDYGIEEGEYYYWLQSVEANNETEMHGPVYLVYTLDNNVPNPEYQYQHNLIGAYPNPFNPSTSIQYELAGAADVQIAIYNAKGQKVKTFIDSHSKKGTYSVHWNGKDENGKFVNSGVYFYTMTAGKTTQSKKMLLVK